MLTERISKMVCMAAACIARRLSCFAVLAALSGCFIGKQHYSYHAHSASDQELESPITADFDPPSMEGYSVLKPDREILIGQWIACRQVKSKLSYLTAKKVYETSVRMVTNEWSFFENGTFSVSSGKKSAGRLGEWEYSEGILKLRFGDDAEWQTPVTLWKSEDRFLLKRVDPPFSGQEGSKILERSCFYGENGLLRTDFRWEDEDGHRSRLQCLASPVFYSRRMGGSSKRKASSHARTSDKIPGRWSGRGRFASAEYEFYGDGYAKCRKKIGKTEIVWSGKWDYSWESMSLVKRNPDGSEERIRIKLVWYSDTEFEFADDGSGAADSLFILKGVKLTRIGDLED